MKQQYYKINPDGTKVWYQGVIKTEEKQIFTWDEELILADGWIKYVQSPSGCHSGSCSQPMSRSSSG